MKHLSWMLPAVVVASGACGGDTGAPPDAAAPPYTARIQRTAFGLPHIDAADERGLGYGIGYAYAEDNACLLADEIVTVNGERARYFGPDQTYQPTGDSNVVVNLQSDVYFAIHNAAGPVAAAWAAQPAEVQDLLRGYALGYNRYLRDGTVSEACRGQPWLRDITELDLVRLLRRVAVEATGMQFIDGLYAAEPPTGAPIREAPRGAALARAAIWRRYQPSLGSNGVALGHDTTASGAGLLLAAPHFPWTSGFRFYELHLTIPGKVDVLGATLAGLPVVGVGFNAQVAWTHTVSSSRHFAFHQLALDPRDATRYLVDGESRPMTATDVAVQVRTPDGLTTVTHRVWSCELGQVIVIPGFLDWTATTAFAFGDANADNTRFVDTWWKMNQARSLAELRAAVETTLGIPWVNTVAVDAGGTAYFGDVTPVPDVDPACVAEGFAPLAATGLVVLDASTAGCGWRRTAGTPSPGIVPAAALPTLTRTDFVQNSNDSAWLTNPAAPLTGFPPLVSIAGEPLRPRTRIGLTQLAAELAAGRPLTADRLLELAFDNRAFHATTLLPDLRALCAASRDARLARGCGALAGWDGTANLASVGWPVFSAWRRALDAAADDSGLDYWTTPFDPADAVATPRGLRTGDPAVAAAARDALIAATRALDDAGVDFRRPWGELQRTAGGIAIHGGGGERFNDGGDDIYNTINSRLVYGTALPSGSAAGRGQAPAVDGTALPSGSAAGRGQAPAVDGTALPSGSAAGRGQAPAVDGTALPSGSAAGRGQAPAVGGHYEPYYGTSITMAIAFAAGGPTAKGALAYSQSSDPASPHAADQTERFSRRDWIDLPYSAAAIAADPALTTLRLVE